MGFVLDKTSPLAGYRWIAEADGQSYLIFLN